MGGETWGMGIGGVIRWVCVLGAGGLILWDEDIIFDHDDWSVSN